MPHLDHVGWATASVREVLDTLDALLDLRPYRTETSPERRIRTHSLDAGDVPLEVVEPLEPNALPARLLDRRGDEIYYLAFAVPDLSAALRRLRRNGVSVLEDGLASGAPDRRRVFINPDDTHGVLIALCEPRVPDWSPRQIHRDDRTLGLFERGDPERETLILVHGSAGSTRLDLTPVMQRLEPALHLVGLDLSGHGASSLPPDNRLSMDRFVGDVEAALDAVEASSAHLFGFSLGTAVALRFAHRHPSRVDRMALFAPKTRWSRQAVSDLQSYLDPKVLSEHHPSRAERLAAEHDDLDALLAALRAFVDSLPDDSDELHATLPDIPAPTLVAGYDADPLVGMDDLRATYDALPAARLTILPGEHHTLAPGPLGALASVLQRHFEAA
jgi:methylmalonyl-CoA/ethylmalonyl-CoA epimerase